MIERRIIFRGFHADKNGDSTITLNGKKIKGTWKIGYYAEATRNWHQYGKHKAWIIVSAYQNGGFFNVMGRHAVIPETVGQWVTTDKNGKDVFEGCEVFCVRRQYGNTETFDGYICYDTNRCCFYVGEKDGTAIDYNICSLEIELIGDKFEPGVAKLV